MEQGFLSFLLQVGLLDHLLLSSLNDLLLNEGVLVQLGHVLPAVELVPTRLRDWYNKALAQTTAHQNGHYAEVKDHCSLRIEILCA